MAISETMRQMAEAVRNGDEAAALALSDALQEGRGDGMALQVPRVAVIGRNAKAIVFQRALDGTNWPLGENGREQVQDAMRMWLDGEASIAVMPSSVERVEIYCKEEA